MVFATRILKSISTSKPVTNDYDGLLPSFSGQNGISHNIFQTCKDKRCLSAPLQQNIERIQQMNPDWAYRLFDDADIEAYIGEHYGKQILAFYHRIDAHYGAAKADFFRYLVIYREGGVYLDIKSTLDKPLAKQLLEAVQQVFPEHKSVIGPVCSGDIFDPAQARGNPIEAQAVAVDMETSAVAEFCHRLCKKCCVPVCFGTIRVISNDADTSDSDNATSDFTAFLQLLAKMNARLPRLQELLEKTQL